MHALEATQVLLQFRVLTLMFGKCLFYNANNIRCCYVWEVQGGLCVLKSGLIIRYASVGLIMIFRTEVKL